jgi:hypothetical protein
LERRRADVPLGRLPEDLLKGFVIGVAIEEGESSRAPIEDAIELPAGGDRQWSSHAG